MKVTIELDDVKGKAIEVGTPKPTDAKLKKSAEFDKKGKTFNINSPKNSPKASIAQSMGDSEPMSPRLPLKNGLTISVASNDKDFATEPPNRMA